MRLARPDGGRRCLFRHGLNHGDSDFQVFERQLSPVIAQLLDPFPMQDVFQISHEALQAPLAIEYGRIFMISAPMRKNLQLNRSKPASCGSLNSSGRADNQRKDTVLKSTRRLDFALCRHFREIQESHIYKDKPVGAKGGATSVPHLRKQLSRNTPCARRYPGARSRVR